MSFRIPNNALIAANVEETQCCSCQTSTQNQLVIDHSGYCIRFLICRQRQLNGHGKDWILRFAEDQRAESRRRLECMGVDTDAL